MPYKMTASLDDIRLKEIEKEVARRDTVVDKALRRIDENLKKQKLRTELYEDEEPLITNIIEALGMQGFGCSYEPSEPGDSFEPMDYGRSAYITIQLV